jgi:hypothetical protein
MSLDAGNVRRRVALPHTVDGPAIDMAMPYAAWNDWQPSRIDHHMKACCEIAREWIVNTDFSALHGADAQTGPRWLRHRFEWGPGTYPIYWCEIAGKKKLDCGVLAALAHEVYTSRGVRSFRAQLVQEFSSQATAQWRSAWTSESAVTDWITDTLIYHEGVAVVARDNELKLWDSSAGWWVDPKSIRGYGAVRAVRVTAAAGTDFRWGKHTIPSSKWTTL